MSSLVGCLHSVSMWFIDSSSAQVGQKLLSGFEVFDQNFPSLCKPCITHRRNCLILGLITLCLVLVQISLSVGLVPCWGWRLALIISKFHVVVFLMCSGVWYFILWYANDCVKADRRVPCISKCAGTSRLTVVAMGSVAPLLASLSLSLFPLLPLCPLTHWRYVGVDHLLSRYAALWNHFLLLMPIQPMSSHFWRWMVSPSIAYLESVLIIRGV
jgi:hypothetical protein